MGLTVESLVLTMSRALAPLEERLRSGQTATLFAEIGMPASGFVLGQQTVQSAIEQTADALAELPDAVAALDTAVADSDAARIHEAITTAVPLVQAVMSAMGAVSDAVRSAAAGAGNARAEVEVFAEELVQRLAGYTLADYLDRERPTASHLMILLGVIQVDAQAATPATPAYTRRVLRTDRLSAILRDPVDVLAQVYGWGTAQFAWDVLLRRLASAFGRVSDFAFVQPGADGQPPFLRIAAIDVGVTADPVPGVQAVLRVEVSEATHSVMPLGDTVAFTTDVDGGLDAGAAIQLLPPADLHVIPPAAEVRGTVRFGVQAPRAAQPQPITAIGSAAGTRIEARALRLGAGADFDWNVVAGRAEGELLIEAEVADSKFVIDMADADGFLAGILPGGPLELDTDLRVAWSSATGLHVTGRAGLDVDLPVDFDVGPVKILALHAGLTIADDGLALELSAAITAKFGPVTLAVDRMGTTTRLSFPDGGGNAGPADLSLTYKPPSGIGVAIDAAVVRGGGFIRLDPDSGEYAGVLELALGPVSVKAAAVLTTRLPGNAGGWSLLLLLFSEFDAIQLGYGFTLDGVGGIVGLQHGVSVDTLQGGLRSGVLDTILFPADPVGSAPQLLGSLRTVFPLVPRAMTVGPALVIGWGTPPIITLRLGVLIQIDDVLGSRASQPQISRVVVIGQLEVLLPPGAGGDVPELIKLLVDIVGAYELRAKDLKIDARLRDSHIAGLPLTGTMVVRANFGDQPNLMLAVGGFHPRFTDIPPGLPAQERVGFELRYDIVTVRIAAYTAITTSTFQIGADAQLSAKGGNFAIEAHLGFDALFEFEPVLHFTIDFRVGASIKYRGHRLASVKVKGTLRGPGRWEVSGHASFSILFWDVSIGFELEWGDVVAALPSAVVAVGAQLVTALSDVANWAAELPVGGNALITLRTTANADAVSAHPLAVLVITQKVVPLGIDITRVGESRPSDGTRFDITKVIIPGREFAPPDYRDEHFARGRYLDLDPEERLSTPSFERFRAGVTVAGSAFTVGAEQVAFEPEFETAYLGEQPPPPERGIIDAAILVAQAHFGAASSSMLRRDSRLLPEQDTRITVNEATVFAAVGENLSGPTGFATFTEASQAIAETGRLVTELAELTTVS
jgi:hypothetical protein